MGLPRASLDLREPGLGTHWPVLGLLEPDLGPLQLGILEMVEFKILVLNSTNSTISRLFYIAFLVFSKKLKIRVL